MRSQLFPSNTTVITWNCLPTSVVTAPFHFHYSRYSFTPQKPSPLFFTNPTNKTLFKSKYIYRKYFTPSFALC